MLNSARLWRLVLQLLVYRQTLPGPAAAVWLQWETCFKFLEPIIVAINSYSQRGPLHGIPTVISFVTQTASVICFSYGHSWREAQHFLFE